MNKFMKKVLAFVLVFAMIAPMMGNLEINKKEVQAAEAEETVVKDKEIGYVIVPKASVDTTGSQPAVATSYESDKYADYLFGGWFSDEDAMTAATSDAEKLYARFVPADVLSTKCQVTTGLVTDTSVDQYRNRYVLRFVSSIDSLDYRHVGFEISYKDGEQTVTKSNKTNTVFERIESTTGTTADGKRDNYSFSPKIMDTKSEYFITAKWPVADTADDKAKDYTVRAFWMTKDGTKVYGESRTVCVNDGLTATDSINLTVINTGNVSVAVGNTLAVREDANLSAEVIGFDSTSVQVRISGVNKAALKSATKFTLTKDGTTVGSEIYRNLYTKYTGSGTADTSWFTVDSNQKEFTIATSADLYGLAKLTNSVVSPMTAVQNFSGKTIYLVSDIIVNEETLVTERTDANYKKWYSASTGEYNTEPTNHDWVPIATNSGEAGKFVGSFDGQMHSISGLYCVNPNTSNNNAGLFARTGAATIKNFSLINSYFMSDTIAGGVSVRSWGATIDTVYSDAIVEVKTNHAGGFTAYSNNITINNSWFDGNVNSISGRTQGGIGGFIGTSYDSTTSTLNNCLYTGCVTNSNVHYTGGFIGVNKLTSASSTMYLNHCLSAGEINIAKGGSVVGVVDGGSLTTTNTYTADSHAVIGYIQGSGKFLVKYPGGESDQTTTGSVANVNIMTYWQSPSSFLGDKAKTAMGGVDFDTIWTTVANETPILRVFEEQTIDTSWYDESSDTYVLYDRADLRGFSKLSQETDFAGKTIKLGNDIVMNTGDEATWATTAPKYAWTPISSDTLPFAGTFDGGMHTISGLYMNTTSSYSGLFASTAATSVIKNLKIEDSYFTSTGMYLGSIAGSGSGKFENVYSNLTVTGTNAGVGGLLGRTAGTANLRYCWNEGTVTNTATGSESTDRRGTGGLIGLVYGTCKIEDCLNKGTVDVTTSSKYVPKAGGLAGGVEAGANFTFTDCLTTGSILVKEGNLGGYFVGCYDNAQITSNTSYGYGSDRVAGYMQNGGKFHISYILSGEPGTSDRDAGNYATNQVTNVNETSIAGSAASTRLYGFDFTNGTWQVVEEGTPILNFSKDLENMDKRWYDASATEYVLYDKGDLYGFAELAKTTNFAGKTMKLGNDIALHEGNAAKWGTNPFLNASDMWTPIGSTSKPFAGTFDGGLYTISGLYMSATAANSGLFGETTADSIIKNVKLENSYLTSSANGMGSIVGKARGMMENIYSNAIVTGARANIGGLVGLTDGTATVLKNVWYEGTATSKDTAGSYKGIGGLIGAVQGTTVLENGLNKGTVDASASTAYVPKVGGLVGDVVASATFTFTDCLNTGDVLVKSGKVGGFLFGCYDKNSVVNCYTSYGYGNSRPVGYKNDASGVFNVYYMDGNTLTLSVRTTQNYYDVPVLKTAETSIKGTAASTRLAGFDFDFTWKTVENGTPVLNFGGNYDEVDTRWYDAALKEYTLYDVGDLYGFAELSKTVTFTGKTIKLGKDIVVNEGKAADWATKAPAKSWVPIGYKPDNAYNAFGGTFDGQGYTISGLYFNRTNRYAGLFACVGANGVVKNVKLTNSYFKSSNVDFGSIVGRLDGKVYMVYSDAIMSGSKYEIGGIAGLTYGKTVEIENCWFDGAITKTENESTRLGIGGIVGMVSATADGFTLTVRNCLNTADIDISVYAQTTPCVGGIIGRIYKNGNFVPQIEIDSCLNTGTFTKNAATTGGVGPIVGYCDAKDSTIVHRTYATESSSGNNIFRDGLYTVDASAIQGSAAEETMPLLGWGTDWKCGAEGKFPEIIFSTTGYGEGAGVTATTTEQETLASYYADRALYQGDIHAHAKTYGRNTGLLTGDDGNVDLATWAKSMGNYDLDFVASLDHHQVTHFDLDVWQQNLDKFVYGTEAGTNITDLTDTGGLEGKLHYNMLFPNKTGLLNVLNTFDNKFHYGDVLLARDDYFEYGDFTKAEFANLIKEVRNQGGFFVHAHPTQTSYSTNTSDYYFADYAGFEVFYLNTPTMDDMTDEEKTAYAAKGAYGSNESAAHYARWDALLKAGKRLYATSGSDTHGELNNYAVTSVYSNKAKADVDKGEIINQLRAGDFVAGAVGIQMSIGNKTMGGECDFNGQKLLVDFNKFHSGVVKTGHKYRVDILNEKGVVLSQAITPGQELTIAMDADESSAYYRVEVYDMTGGYRIAIGNPIWNK